MSDRDILEEMQKTGSQKRYRPIRAAAAVATPNETRSSIQRASRTAEHPLVRRTADYSEPVTRAPRAAAVQPQQQPRRTAEYQQQARRTMDVDTNSDVEVAPSVRRLRDEKVQPTKKLPEQHRGLRFHWLVYAGIGMIASLALWILIVLSIVAWRNGISDPAYYTQTAHRDVVTVTTAQGHQSQVRAFIDAQNHLDLLVMPTTGDTSKAHVIVGPLILFHDLDLSTATVVVTAKGSVVTVSAQGPVRANYLVVAQDNSTWMYDLAPSKGGH